LHGLLFGRNGAGIMVQVASLAPRRVYPRSTATAEAGAPASG
jgi:hypothetical protein